MKRKPTKIKNEKRSARHLRVRKRIKGAQERPRLSVFRSNKHIYAQLINDEVGVTLVSASDFEIKESKRTKKDKAFDVGKLLAEKAKAVKLSKVIFDRGGFKFHGRVKSLADGAREGGLIF